MKGPYIDVATGSPCKEFSIHRLNWDHLIVIWHAMKQYCQVADQDVNQIAKLLPETTEADLELLIEACRFRKIANELVEILKDVE